ncbi:MAG: vitamin K epoxide reductase family protein [Anaerolineales bacterium]
MKRLITILGALTLLFGFLWSVPQVRAQAPQVRVVFFTSPVCQFCEQVEERDLSPLESEYGEQLHILRVDTTTGPGQRVFREALEMYDVPPERHAVPMMILEGNVLVGAGEIPAQLPGLVASTLAEGGNEWPPIPGLEGVIEEAELEAAGVPLWLDRFRRDLPGNYLSAALLVVMLVLAVALFRPRAWQERLSQSVPGWVRVGIALIGLGVALYLLYGETPQGELMCGPIGQCDAVQQSQFAVLFGILPMALFGVLGYLAILVSYAYERWDKGPYVELAPLLSFGLTGFGFAFSIFLTYLQPFVIGATCLWCLTSAVTMSLSFLFTAGRAWPIIEKLRTYGWRAYLRFLKRQTARSG